ncbi:MAG: hypothetical protein FWG44_08530 [Oscillospiraceae bacterium]|nr:hypothetical protein [Oscillospiraceae bacterium]
MTGRKPPSNWLDRQKLPLPLASKRYAVLTPRNLNAPQTNLTVKNFNPDSPTRNRKITGDYPSPSQIQVAPQNSIA